LGFVLAVISFGCIVGALFCAVAETTSRIRAALQQSRVFMVFSAFRWNNELKPQAFQ
jgi:hypothetical protein